MKKVELQSFIESLKSCQIRDDMFECYCLPENTTVVKQFNYCKETMDYVDIIYNSAETDERRPAFIFLSGYSCDNHHIQFYPHAGYFSAKYNAVCYMMHYKNMNMFTYPEPFNSTMRLKKWIIDNADLHNVDNDRIYVVGGYVGGSVAAMLASERTDTTGDSGVGGSHEIAAAVCLGAPFDYEACIEEGEKAERLRALLGTDSPGEHMLKEASPIFNVHQDMSRVLVLSGKKDKLVPYAVTENMVEELQDKGVQFQVKTWENSGHGWFNYGPELFEVIENIEEFIFEQ